MAAQYENAMKTIRSLPSRGAWIEIMYTNTPRAVWMSLPSRGAWIEIVLGWELQKGGYVAPLAGSVDRNRQFDP